ncbi:MAG: DUF4157 domain-containing protein [Saprospiraceae bacterium]|nr:DUF4157 domain-containing protein [Saprospiraceae bacterium]
MKTPASSAKQTSSRANAVVVGQKKKGARSGSPLFADQRSAAVVQGKLVRAIQRMSGPEEEELLQGKFAGTASAQGGVVQRQNDGMSTEVQAKMETAMNSDFSDVKIHANSQKAPQVGALAFTQGNQVHFAPGQFKPDTRSGQELLGHELAHVVQQRKGIVKPTTEAAGLPVNDNPHFEREADRLGKKAAGL